MTFLNLDYSGGRRVGRPCGSSKPKTVRKIGIKKVKGSGVEWKTRSYGSGVAFPEEVFGDGFCDDYAGGRQRRMRRVSRRLGGAISGGASKTKKRQTKRATKAQQEQRLKTLYAMENMENIRNMKDEDLNKRMADVDDMELSVYNKNALKNCYKKNYKDSGYPPHWGAYLSNAKRNENLCAFEKKISLAHKEHMKKNRPKRKYTPRGKVADIYTLENLKKMPEYKALRNKTSYTNKAELLIALTKIGAFGNY